jgi:small subunit ribosomal protein S6
MARLQSQRDTPNSAREYETIYILRPNTPNEGVAEVNTKVKAVIEGLGGKIVKVDNWGKRRLAYEVAKERKGIYLYWLYLGNPGIVEEAERNLRMLDNVIRFLTVKVDENVDVGVRPIEIDDTSYERAATTAADEEDIFLKGMPEGGEGDDLGDSDDDDFVYEDPSTKKPVEPEAAAAAEAPASAEDDKEKE